MPGYKCSEEEEEGNCKLARKKLIHYIELCPEDNEKNH